MILDKMCYGGTFTFVFDVDKRLRGPENSTSPGALFHCREKGGDMSPQGGPFPLSPPLPPPLTPPPPHSNNTKKQNKK